MTVCGKDDEWRPSNALERTAPGHSERRRSARCYAHLEASRWSTMG